MSMLLARCGHCSGKRMARRASRWRWAAHRQPSHEAGAEQGARGAKDALGRVSDERAIAKASPGAPFGESQQRHDNQGRSGRRHPQCAAASSVINPFALSERALRWSASASGYLLAIGIVTRPDCTVGGYSNSQY